MRTALHTRLNKIIAKLPVETSSLKEDPAITIERNKLENNFYYFMQQAWPWIEGNKEFVPGWHIEVICEHLEESFSGKVKDLLINMPPRCMKSTIIAVGFPAWSWTKDPSLQFLFTSYALSLSKRDSRKCPRLIESPWYQKYWGHKFKLTGDSNTVLRFDNTAMGYRIASSVGGAVTGEGGDFIVSDDPNAAKSAQSETIRESTNDWWDHAMSTRLNDPKTGRIIVVMQRLHVQDMAGHLLAQDNEDLVHLCLPMEFERDQQCITVPLKSTKGKRWKDPRKKEGDLLWPNRFGTKELMKLKLKLASEYAIAGQLQQRPAPAEGGIFKEHWFKIWDLPEPPNLEIIMQSWDTALSKEADACYSACTTWGVFKDNNGIANIILLNLWRGRVEYPDLRKMAQRLAANYHDVDFDNPSSYGPPPDVVLIEAQANGLSLIQDLAAAGIPVSRFNPRKYGDKVSRARLASILIEGGRVWLPAIPPNYDYLREYSETMLEACCMFPNAESNDLVDSMTQTLIRLKETKWVTHPSDWAEDIDPLENYDRPLI
jgi:predicted phage terminase large subunit-like protein